MDQGAAALPTCSVSLSGFLCACTVDLPVDSIVEVYLIDRATQYVGKIPGIDFFTRSCAPFPDAPFPYILL